MRLVTSMLKVTTMRLGTIMPRATTIRPGTTTRHRDGVDSSLLISEDGGMGKSELSIVGLTQGNAGRAKGRRIEVSVRRSMGQTLG